MASRSRSQVLRVTGIIAAVAAFVLAGAAAVYELALMVYEALFK